MEKRFFIFLILSAVVFPGCSQEEQNGSVSLSVDPMRAFSYVKEIAEIGPRPSGSAGATKNVEYICDKLKSLNVDFSTDKWEENTPVGNIKFCNVVAEIKGEKSDFIILGAHYDTKLLQSVPNFLGANDAASGVGLMLAMIESIVKSAKIPHHTIKFAFFDGEECFMKYGPSDGLFGSRRMAGKISEEKAKCVAMILLDMVGDNDLNIEIPVGSDEKLAGQIFQAAEKRGKRKYFNWSRIGMTDDHTPFLNAGIPAVDIIDFNFGSSNLYWHSSEDSIDKISPENLGIVGDVTLEMIMNLEH